MKLSLWRKCICVGFLAPSVFSTTIAGVPPMYTTYSGVVVDSSTNTPIAGAKIFSSTFVDLATSGVNGAFTFNLPRFGTAASIWYLSVFAQGYGLYNWPLALNALMADSTVKLSRYEYATLQRGVRGTVQDRSSSLPVAGCEVELRRNDSVWIACNSSLGAASSCMNSNLGGGVDPLNKSDMGGWWSIREAFVSRQKTDSLGRFAFLAMPDNSYKIKISAPEYISLFILTEPAGTAAPETRSIFLTRESATVSGIITDTLTGKPIRGVALELRQVAYRASDTTTPFGYYVRDTITTKTDGTYQFTELLCNEHYSLYAVAHGYYDDSTEVPKPTGCSTTPRLLTANLALSPSLGSVGGFVRDLHSKWPIDSATVYLYAKIFVKKGALWAMDDTLIDSTASNHTGAYAFTDLPENIDYSLYAVAPLYHLSDDVAFQANGGNLTAATLLPGLQFGVAGAINDSSSSLPIKGAQVTVYARRRGVSTRIENVPLDSGFTDSTGFFSFPLSPTDAFTTGYLVTAQAAGFVLKSIPVSSIDTLGPSVAGADFFLVAGNAPVLYHAHYVDNTLPPQMERNCKGVFVTTSRSARVQLYDLRGVILSDRTVVPGKTLLLRSSTGGRLCIARISEPGTASRTFKMMVIQ